MGTPISIHTTTMLFVPFLVVVDMVEGTNSFAKERMCWTSCFLLLMMMTVKTSFFLLLSFPRYFPYWKAKVWSLKSYESFFKPKIGNQMKRERTNDVATESGESADQSAHSGSRFRHGGRRQGTGIYFAYPDPSSARGTVCLFSYPNSSGWQS